MNDDPARFKRELIDLLIDDHSKPFSIQELNDAWKKHIKDTFARQNKSEADANKWLTNFEVTNHCK